MDAEELADKVLAALKNMGAIGAGRAVTQAALALRVGCPKRLICDATLTLNRRGIEACSTCGDPPGVFLAESFAELDDYDRQLKSRLVGNAMRRGYVRRIRRTWLATAPVEPGGQRRLFA